MNRHMFTSLRRGSAVRSAPASTLTRASSVETPVYRRGFGGRGPLPGQFVAPAGLAIDGRGSLYVADSGNDRVQVFARDGRWLRTLGVGLLSAPEAVAVSRDGAVFVADTGNHRVVQFSWWGATTRIIGEGELTTARGVAVDAGGALLVADTGNDRVLRFDGGGQLAGTVTARMAAPRGVAVNATNGVLVAQHDADGVVSYDGAGAAIGTRDWSLRLPGPAHLALGPRGRVYVTAPEDGQVHLFHDAGRVTTPFGSEHLRSPSGIAVDDKGKIFVADAENHRIIQFATRA
jgi:DNA-binding beta-propeller fold protein YncE